MLTKILTPKDIKTFLNRLAAAIERDQVNVDALPRERFSIAYNDSMWRSWRQDHRDYIEKLLSTVEAIPPVVLKQLTEIAAAYEPELVGGAMLELFAEVVSGSSAEDVGSAERFFGALIKEMSGQRKRIYHHVNAPESVMQWLEPADPLRIARDPECQYGSH
ncbi:hypothetical protein GPL21_07035 [Bradyrhizobium pachyrhizi]|uniref:Uncharacterized protein n=1 Tax=Bradyrhizobium pachyrhizi TaxID=280333 RepID=A0A844SQZ8_9BRAD|nr:hypothetical protein [Bradyrhizobium pachyrhizi]MVT64860.1 hypothetical protein [Bradyrhizobium pachyrhizi]